MTWIRMEIPCHFTSQIDSSLVQIHTKFHYYSMSFKQVLFVFHAKIWHGFCTSSTHGISTAFAKKMMGFPSDLVSFSIKLRQKDMRKSVSHFLQGYSNISTHCTYIHCITFFRIILHKYCCIWTLNKPSSSLFMLPKLNTARILHILSNYINDEALHSI